MSDEGGFEELVESLADPANAKVPPMDELRKAAEHTNLHKLILDEANQTAYLDDPDMALDVGSVAKGYATEIVAKELEAAGWNSFILSSGGNVRAGGSPLDGKRTKWGVGITDPSNPEAGTSDEATLDTVFCTNMSVTTAGDGASLRPPPPRLGRTTTARPLCLPLGMRMMSPILRFSSDTAAAARIEAERAFAPSFSIVRISLRMAAYSEKSPRWHVIASA